MTKEGSNLKNLGCKSTEYKLTLVDSKILEAFENKYLYRDYFIELIFTEFTSLCPKTGQPDFATIKINYIPEKLCIESKSLKLYLFSYRQYGGFMETIINKILDDLVNCCNPKQMEIFGQFNSRGGVHININAKFKK